MMIRRIFLVFFLLGFLSSSKLSAQETSLLQLSSDTTALETGQQYTIRIEVHDVTELWAANLLIQYDPQYIYVVGTKSGSPVRLGDMMRDGGDTIFNSVNSDKAQLNYAASMFNPADPVSGTGIIGTFEIVPLLAGKTQLSFFQAELLTVNFSFDANGQRSVGNPVKIDFLPVLLDLSITGDPATPPAELTATPQATVTIDPALIPGGLAEETQEALVNVTAVPTPLAPLEAPVESSASPLLIIAVVMVLLSGFGLIGLFVYVRRK